VLHNSAVFDVLFLDFCSVLGSGRRCWVEAYEEVVQGGLQKHLPGHVGDAPSHGVLSGVSPGLYKRIRDSGRAYVGRAEMEGWLREQTPERLARCLQILAVLGQAKAYLYWCRDGMEEKKDG